MTESITFTVWGNPLPMPRPRVTERGAYIPRRVHDWKAAIAAVYRQLDGPMYDGPVSIVMHFYRKTAHRVDIDNLAKSVMDGLEGYAYQNDSQVKFIMADLQIDREAPHVRITLEPWAGAEPEGGQNGQT